jgi:16S rRNA (cytidine1402-2'-O)-methyltransferase
MAIGGTVIFFEAPHRIRTTLERLLQVAGDCQVAVGRELTKAHEELVRGPISVALRLLSEPRGEFTVVVYIGHTTNNDAATAPGGELLLAEFGQLTDNGKMRRRAAIAALAKKYGQSSGDVYQAIEQAKKRGQS